MLGHHLDGTQAEYARIPHAALSLHPLPDFLDPRAAVALSDALPTGLECGTLAANVQPGGTVMIVGAGPVGMAALLTALLYTPRLLVMVDRDEARLKRARELGAQTVHADSERAREQLLDLTEGQGFDSVIEAVGIPATFELCQRVVAIGGRIAKVGVHGTHVDSHLDQLWDRNISIHMQLVNGTSTQQLMSLVTAKKLELASLVTHRESAQLPYSYHTGSILYCE